MGTICSIQLPAGRQMEPFRSSKAARDLDLTDDLDTTVGWGAMSRSLRLRYEAATRRISNASSAVHRFWPMMMPRAWSMMVREARAGGFETGAH